MSEVESPTRPVEDGPSRNVGEEKEESRIPRRYFIGTISALAFTTGLTLTLIPALRFRRNRQRALQTQVNAQGNTPARGQVGAGIWATRREVGEVAAQSASGGGAGGGGGMVLLPGLKPKPQQVAISQPSIGSIAPQRSSGMVLLPTSAARNPASNLPATSTPSPIADTTSSIPAPSDGEALTPLSPSIKWFSLKPASPWEDNDHDHGHDDPTRPHPRLATNGQATEANTSQTRGEGTEEPRAEPLSPLFALNAFLLATAAVCLLGAGGAVGVGRWLDVHDMDEFTAKLREMYEDRFPQLRGNIYKPLPDTTPPSSTPSTLPVDHTSPAPTINNPNFLTSLSHRLSTLLSRSPTELDQLSTPRNETAMKREERLKEEEVVGEWWRGMVGGMEEERRRVVEGRKG